MNAEQLASLVARLERAAVSELTYRDGSETLTLRFTIANEPSREVAPCSTTPNVQPQGLLAKPPEIVANATGTFTRAHPLDLDPPLKAIRQGDLVGYLTVDSVISAITAQANGRAGHQLVDDGKTVGYGEAVLEFHDA